MKKILKRLIRRPQKKELPIIPKMDFSQITGGDELQIRLLETSFADGNVSLFELFTIASLVYLKKPRAIFEIGTFNGRTTLNMAANSEQQTKIYTLDLPGKDVSNTAFTLDAIEKKYVEKPVSGTRFSNYPEAEKITQLYGDSAKFNFSEYENSMDFVFVDASHAYEYVLSDSKIALRLLRGGKGVVLWHDYDQYWWPGVTKGLNQLYDSSLGFSDLVHFSGTSLVCMIKK